MSRPQLLGRLGDEKSTIVTDPRSNPAMVEFLKNIGVEGNTPAPPFGLDCTREQLLDYLRESHVGLKALMDNVPYQLPGDDQSIVSTEVRTIKGGGGQDMKLHITKPKDASGSLPCIIYTHGGAMTLVVTDNPLHQAWCRDLALGGSGAVVVMPDFRNAYDDEKHDLRPFPAGLNDCAAAVEWVGSRKDELGMDKILICGESGGANLALATTLKLKKEGKKIIDGVHVRCPYISGAYAWPREKIIQELPSLAECDGYWLAVPFLAILMKAYHSSDEDHTNPLSWPYHATEEELKGAVPHMILVDELDPLRDEGLAFVRKLERSGVKTIGRMSVGTIHGAPQLMRIALQDLRFQDIEDMHSFMKRL